MNDSELELNLRALRPAAPSPGLEERIAAVLDRPAASTATPTTGVLRTRLAQWRPLWQGLGWAALGATAAVAAMTAWQTVHETTPTRTAAPTLVQQPVPSTPEPSLFEAAASAQELVASEEAGTVYDADDLPSTLVRYSSIERHTWTNPTTGAEVAVEVPRTDLVLIPTSYQ